MHTATSHDRWARGSVMQNRAHTHTPCLTTALRHRLYDWEDALAQSSDLTECTHETLCTNKDSVILFLPSCCSKPARLYFSMEHERRYFETVVVALFHAIVPSQGAWLAGDLTNPNAAILSNKQIRQESRLTLVNLNLKNGVYWRLSAVKIKHLLMFIHVYLIHAVSKYEKMMGSCATWTEPLQRSVTTH